MSTIKQYKMSKNADINLYALLFVVTLTAFVFLTAPAFADEFGESLTDLFQTRVFRGSWEFVTRFGWIAGLMNWVISAFSFIGMCLIMISRITSLLYLTNRPIFDQIYDIKNDGKGQSFFGLKNAFNDTFNAKYDTGADSILNFLLGLAPNIKRYSDYNPERPNPAIDENDSVLNYFLKMLPSTVALMVFLSMGYGGQLGKAYGMIVDGLMVVADEFVAFKLDDFIEDTIHIGENYKFTLNNDGTEQGKVKQAIANSVYRNVASKFSLNTDQKQSIGRSIEQLVQSGINAGSVQNFVGSNLDMNSDNAWSAIKSEVTMNSNPVADGAIMTIDLKSNLGFTGDSDMYIHIFVRQNGNAGTDFFQP